MSIFKQFKMDESKEQNGAEVKYGANEDGTVPTFHILRSVGSNQRYAKTLAREVKPYKRLIALEALDAATSEKIMLNVFVDSVLVGWENVQNQKNELIPFTRENSMSLMKQLPDLYADLQAQANNAALFRAESLEGDAKN